MTIALNNRAPNKLTEATKATNWTITSKSPDLIYFHKCNRITVYECKGSSSHHWIKANIELDTLRQLQGYMRIYSPTSTLTLSSIALPDVSISRIANIRYKNRDNIYSLLGDEGRIVLDRIIKLIHNIKQELNWPLKEVDIQCVQDAEIETWQYVLVVFIFICELDIAYNYLNAFYSKLDEFQESLTEVQETKLRELISFDVQMSLSGAKSSSIS